MRTQKHSKATQQSAPNNQIAQLIQAYAQTAGVDPKQIMVALQKMNSSQQQGALKKMAQAVQSHTQQPQQMQESPREEQTEAQQGQQNPQEESQEMKSGGWIKGAVNPKHVGFCTPMTKATCTPRRKAFAIRAKHHFKEEGGDVYKEGGLSREDDYGSKSKPYPSVASEDFAGGNRSYPIPTRADAVDALRLAHLHHREDVIAKVHQKYPDLAFGGIIEQFRAGGSYATSGVPTNGSIKVFGNHNINPDSYNPHRFNPQVDTDKLNPVADKINASVGPVDDQYATIEAEKGEKIVKPNLTGIWEINGKKHSEGGTALNPEPGSFIFSNDPNLAITKSEKKLFEFKEGGSISKRKNTPSKVLGREIDLKEYNRYMSILQNPKAETIEKATAALMVDKYQKKMGQVAYLQEQKKNEQAPSFSQGTLPMTNPTIQKQEDEQKMYKMGGYYDLGDEVPCPCGGVPPNCTPCTQSQLAEFAQKAPRTTRDKVPNDYNFLGKVPTGDIYNKQGLYGKGQVPNAIPGGKPNNQWQDAIIRMVYNGATPEQLIAAKHITPQGWQQVFKPYFDSVGMTKFGFSTPDKQLFIPNGGYDTTDKPKPPIPPITAPPAGDITPQSGTAQQKSVDSTIPTLPYDIRGQLTPAQKAHLGYLGLQAMNVKKYMPMREQIHLPDTSLDKINLQPFLNNINNQNFQAYNSLNSVDPRSAKLMASNILGKGLDSTQQAIGQVEGQNVQIGNQENLTNTQRHDQEQEFNVGATGKYYDQTVAANQNFDDERRFAKNQVVSTLNDYQSQQDAQAWALASINKYGLRKVVDPKTGKVYNQPTPLYEPTNNGIRYNADVANIAMASGYTRENSMTQYYDALEKLTKMGFDKKSAAYIIANMMKAKQPIYNTNPALQP